MTGLAEVWRRWRRQIKSNAPFVRRREYGIVERKYSELIEAINGLATPASQARVQVRKPLTPALEGEVCLFVSHAARPALKRHVAHHIESLLDAGIQVVLIINTHLCADQFTFDDALEARLSGLLVRENTGFDFGAWAHAYSLQDRGLWTRLFLVNDSMVGPLDKADFDSMLNKIRASPADFIGLTENAAPIRHVQSYFMVLGVGAMCHPAFDRLMQGILNFPDKGQVVDVYETRWVQRLRAMGLHSHTIFPALSSDFNHADDTAIRWERLISTGFPYLKTRVVQQFPHHPLVRQARARGRVDEQV